MDSRYYQNKRKAEQKQRDIAKYSPVRRVYTPRDAEYWNDDLEESYVSTFKKDEDYMSDYQKKEWNDMFPVVFSVGMVVGCTVVVIFMLIILSIFTGL
ncbi:hypothetical protein [Lysinibacillus sp. Bpr_S20]|uniref:hypothetical protein n=1 Tax=Lysinibacillus sp. Bpr_S20 TaxID=2933964 RepID=UPI0020120134|nr:hypothetical protein [Lysinibacillus sp. Bpr_S20]MCL1700778.1 hypothetical protein [Lysinibacillus sp. Bpr_S20]